MRTGEGASGTGYLLRAQVRGRGKRMGTIAFRDGRRVLADVAVDGRTGQATMSVVLSAGSHRFRATYSGNAFLAPDASRTVGR
jgi:hypothetical protein